MLVLPEIWCKIRILQRIDLLPLCRNKSMLLIPSSLLSLCPMCGEGTAYVGGLPAIEAFEFVDTLKVSNPHGDRELILEDIDLNRSRRLVDGEWEPIPTGVFSYFFP